MERHGDFRIEVQNEFCQSKLSDLLICKSTICLFRVLLLLFLRIGVCVCVCVCVQHGCLQGWLTFSKAENDHNMNILYLSYIIYYILSNLKYPEC